MTTETTIVDERWSFVTEQTILLHDGLKYIADLVCPPESISKSLSFDLVDSGIEFRFDPTWVSKLSETLRITCTVEHSPYHLFYLFRQRGITTLWEAQRKSLHKYLLNSQSKSEPSLSTVSKQDVSFTSHISLLLLLPLLQSQARTDPSLPANCIALLVSCLKECSPHSLSCEPLSCINGLKELLLSWIDTDESMNEGSSSEHDAKISFKEDIVAAFTALACGGMSLKTLIQLLMLLMKHRISLSNISIGNVLCNALKYICTAKYTQPSLLRSSHFTTQWPCNPFPDSPVVSNIDEKCPSISCNGKYLFVTNASGKGLAKVGTGNFGSLRGFVYNVNLCMENGWVAWNENHLLFRPQYCDNDNQSFCLVVDPFSLQVKTTVEFNEPIEIPYMMNDNITTVQFTSDGVHLFWIFTTNMQQTSQPKQESEHFQLFVYQFKLEMKKSDDIANVMANYQVVSVKEPVIISIKKHKMKDATHFSGRDTKPEECDLGLTQEGLLHAPIFVGSNMLVILSPHSPLSCDPKMSISRSKKNPTNCCFSLFDGHLVRKDSVIDCCDDDGKARQRFFIQRLGICCDPCNDILWTFGHGSVQEWTNSGYPSLSQVMQQLSMADVDISNTIDLLSPEQVISFVIIQVSILSKALDACLNASLSTELLFDDTCLQLVYDVLHLAIVNKHQSTIISLLQALQPFLKLTDSKNINPDPQLVKNLQSLVWMLACSDSVHSHVQIEACKALVSGLPVFYREPKEKSGLLMVLLSEKVSSGVLMLREMLLRQLASIQLNSVQMPDAPYKLAYDTVSCLIKTCQSESSRSIALCASLDDEEFFKFAAVQPESSAALTYISTLVTKTWKDLMMSQDCNIDGSQSEASEFISKNAESVMLANKIFDTSQKLFKDISEVLSKMQSKEKNSVLSSRLSGVEKVVKASPIGQVLVLLMTIFTHPKICSLSLATRILSTVTSTTIAATKTAKLFSHLQASTTQSVVDTDQSLISSLPDLSIWTRSCRVESIHPIHDDYKFTKTVTFKGARCLYVKFDPRCATQYEYDKVNMYGNTIASGKKVGEYGGNSYGYGSKGVVSLGWPKDAIAVEGESVTISFHVKSTRERNTPDRAVWGFACTISLNKDEEEGDIVVPVFTDVALGLQYLNYKLLGILYNGPSSVNEEDICKHLLDSQLLQRCVWGKVQTTQESDVCGISITVTPDKSIPPCAQQRHKLSHNLIKRLRDMSGILAPTLRPSIQQALQPKDIEEVILAAVIRHLDMSEVVLGLELLQVVDLESSKYQRLCETTREVFRRLDGILRQFQAMAEVELRWSQEVDDIRKGLLQPSAAFFNEYHLQEVKSKELELLCSVKDIPFDSMEQERVVGKLIELLDSDAKSDGVQYDSKDVLSRMPRTREKKHTLMECGELLCSVTIKNESRKDIPERSISQGTFSAMNLDDANHKSEDKTALFYRSLSAPSQLHRSLSVQEGAKDLRRLQRWRTAVQQKSKALGVTSSTEGISHSLDYGTIVDDIFIFVGSDRDKTISCDSFLTAARIRNERGLSRVQALLHMRDLINMSRQEVAGSLPNMVHTVASILSQGPKIDELKCGGLAEAVREEFSNVVQLLLRQASINPRIYSDSIITLSVCPFSWQEERCVIRSGLIALLDKLCVIGHHDSELSPNLSSMAWASFEVLLDRFVQWEKDQDYRSGAIEWSGLAYQVSSLITNYLNAVLQRSTQNKLRTRDALQLVLKLLQSIAKSKMGEAMLQQSCIVSTLLSVLLDCDSPPKQVLAVLRLSKTALPFMTEETCQELQLPNNYLDDADLTPTVKVAKILLMKLGEFVLPVTPLEDKDKAMEKKETGVDSKQQYSVSVHKRVNQPSHEVVQKIMRLVGQRSASESDIVEDLERAVHFDKVLTQNNQILVMTDVLSHCQDNACQLANMGLVTSIEQANRELEPSNDEKQLKSSEEICHLRNRKLAGESCRPFISGQVSLAMASEVIFLLQGLLSSCCSDSNGNSWSTAIQTVLADALKLVPCLLDSITENIEQLIQYLLSEGHRGDLPAKQEELWTNARHVIGALCLLGGFQHSLYPGCKAKVSGDDLVPATYEIIDINESQCTASVLCDNCSMPRQSTFDVPLARLELTGKQVVLVDTLGLTETTIEALHAILTTRDVTLSSLNAAHDCNDVLLRTSVVRVLCEIKTRASMALACQLKSQVFCDVFNHHGSSPTQTIQTLANHCDPGERLPLIESYCQELRKLFKDLLKRSAISLKGKVKDVTLDLTKDFPPVQGVVMSERCLVAHLVCEGNNLQSAPRGSYIYSTVSIPVKAPSFYWEVEVLSLGNDADNTFLAGGCSLSMGLAPTVTNSSNKWSSPVGACLIHDNGIAVHYKRGGFTSWETINTGLVLMPGHVLGCGYQKSDDGVNTLYFTHNGQRLSGYLNDINAGLWPVVHLQKTNVKVRVNFGNSPFKYAKGSEIRQAAELVTDSMEEIRNMLQELPFAQGSDEEIEREGSVIPQESSSKKKNKPDPFTFMSSEELIEYDPSSSLGYLLTSTCDSMTDIGPSTQLKEDNRQTESLDLKTASPTDLLVKAWEEKVFPVIRRRFRNEADRRSGLEQIRCALQAGLMDIAIATLEDIYEESGGIPNSLTMPRLEDVKDDVNKITINSIKLGMAVVISTNLLEDSSYLVPEMKKTVGLNGIVLAIDRAQQLVEVQTYNREEGHLTRFWYPVSILEKPCFGLGRSSSFLAMRSDDNTHFDAQKELLRCEGELSRLKCQEGLIEALGRRSLSMSDEGDSLVLMKTLARHLLKTPYCNGSTAPSSLPSLSSPRQCLLLTQLLPTVIFYSEPNILTGEVYRFLDACSVCGEDEMIKLTNALCQCLRKPLVRHREFVVSQDSFEEEVYLNDVAVSIVTCRVNPSVHSGWMNSKNPLISVLCYYVGLILSKSSTKSRYKAVQYPALEPHSQEKFPTKILPTNRLLVRHERHSMVGPVVDLHGLSADVLLGLVFLECFIQRLEALINSRRDESVQKCSYRAAVYTVIETASNFILKVNLPPVIKEIVFHLIAQLLRLNRKQEASCDSAPSQVYTTQLSLILTRLAPLKTELQKLLDKEVSVTNASAIEFILKGNFEKDKFTSYLKALFEVVLAMAEVTPLMRDRSGSKRQRQGSLTEVLPQGELAELKSEGIVSPSSFTFASFDFKTESETPPLSPVTTPTPPSNIRPRRRDSLRKRKRAHVQEVVSPTDSMPWFDAVASVILLLRNLLEHDTRGNLVVQDSLCAVVSARPSSVIQRLLVITNIPRTMTKRQVLHIFKKACKPCGGISENQTYLPEVVPTSESLEQHESSEGNWNSLTHHLPSAVPKRIRGHAVIELRNSTQLDLARQAIAANKSFKESLTEQENVVGIAKVNPDLLMAGTNELEAFKVFDDFLAEKLYCREELRPSSLEVLKEIFNTCIIALSQSDLGKDHATQDVLTQESGTHSTRSTFGIDKTCEPRQIDTIDERLDADVKTDVRVLQQRQFQENEAYPEVISKDLEIPCSSPKPQVLNEDQICTPTTSNLLFVFFQTFCHGKQKIQDVVRDVINDHGIEIGKGKCLAVDGFIKWIKDKSLDNIRTVWKAVFACGYDLQFQRCTYIFPKDILQDHTNWSLAKDKALVNFIDYKCRALSTSPSRLMPDELHVTQADLVNQQYEDLQNRSLLSVRSRFAFLKSVNQTVEHLLLPMADLRVAETHSLSTATLLKNASGLMFYDTKMAFLNRTLDHSSQRNCSNSSPEISLDPLETLEADKVSSSSQFCQAARYLSSVASSGLRVKVASGGDPMFPLRVQLRGEQVLGSGGSFRHFMWLMARELQSQHINLLIPCPSIAANKNKGMLILKPGAMSYSEEKLLVFFGQLLGIALRSDIPLAIDLMPVFWKCLLGLPLDPQTDLYETDVLTYNYVRRFSEVDSIEEFNTLCYEANLCPYRFVYTSLNGQEIELCPNGANKSVTWDNHHEYIDLIRELRMNELSCRPRMTAVRCGLYSVIPIHELCVLQPSDLQKRTCGIPHVDLDFLKAHTTYVAGVNDTDQHIEYFWNVLESFSQDQLCKFVKFACNQERLPSTCTCQKGSPNTADVHVPPYPMKIGPPDGTGRSDARYIRVETCMFMVKLPQYSTQEITNQKLLYAINCREDPLTDI